MVQIQSSFEEAFNSYLATNNLNQKSKDKYLFFYHKLINLYPELNQKNLDLFLQFNTSSPARATIKNLLKSLLRWDLPQEIKTEIASLDISAPTGKKDKIIPRFMQKSDVDRLDIGIDINNKPLHSERIKLMILTQFYAGLRVSELIGLTYTDLHKENYEKGKNNQFQEITINAESAKFGKERIAFLPTDIYLRLIKWVKDKIQEDDKKHIFFKKEEPIWIFDGKKIKVRKYTGLLNEWSKKVLGGAFNSHSLRHGRGRDLMLNEHKGIEFVKGYLGHADITSTQVYANMTNKDIKNELENKQNV